MRVLAVEEFISKVKAAFGLICRMGRVKLKIKRLESTSNRQVTYSKRRSGILKKANELSILCDIDILLLMFSPNGRPTLFHGERSNVEEVVAKFAQLTPQERAKRKLESLEALKKTFKKLDHDVHVQEFLGGSTQTVEELTNQVRHLQARITEIHQRLSSWCNLDKIDNAEHLRQMEDMLRQSLQWIRLHKESLRKHQLMSLDTSSQFQNGIQLPLMIGGMQEVQPLSWLPIPNNQSMILQDGSNFLPQTNIECSTDASFPGLGGYYDTGKQPETDSSGQINSSKQDSSGLTELGTSGCMSLHLTEQYSYPSYNSMNLQHEEKSKPESEMNLQGIPMEYQFNGNFALPRSVYDNGHHPWVPPSAPCALTMFDGNPYQQQPH